jgi:ubiquinone/menaquinone biosynthesis C-methylase UbiE
VGFYSRVIFPCLCDMALKQPFVAKHRHELLSRASGEILEIGFGTGLNLPHYPEQVHKITVVDPNPGMHRKAQKRIEQSGSHLLSMANRTALFLVVLCRAIFEVACQLL